MRGTKADELEQLANALRAGCRAQVATVDAQGESDRLLDGLRLVMPMV